MTFKLRTLSRCAISVLSTSALLLSSHAFAGGYEKPNTFSGKWGGLGGAAASSVSGAEALFFNPAGLAGGDSTIEVTGDFSPTIINFSGPISGNASVSSANSFFPGFGAFASFKPTSKLGVAVGTYLSGGAKAIYDSVDFTNAYVPFGGPANPALAASNAKIQSDLNIIEFSAGAGYEIVDGLRLGLGYRAAMVHAALSSYGMNPISNTLTTLTIDQISGTAWNGFRVGLQYYPKESRWGVGAQWRTAVNFTGKGKVSGQVTLNTATATPTVVALNPTDASVTNTFPQQFDLGGHFDILPNGLRMYLQYTFTNYSVDKSLAIVGDTSLTLGPTTTVTSHIPNIDQNWLNEHDLRVGFDCFEVQKWAFRLGYVLSSQVTPTDRARATFTPPGFGHTFALGAGTSWLNNTIDTNLALEYAFSQVTVTTSNPPQDLTSGQPGKYWASDYAAHIGVTYHL